MGAGLEGTRALVVGASAGIGRAVASNLVAAGAAVAFSARRSEALAQAVAEAAGGSGVEPRAAAPLGGGTTRGRGVAVVGDISDPAACERIVVETVAALGGLDLVVFSVGVAPLRRLLETSAEDWRRVFDTNTIGVQQVVRAAVPALGTAGTVVVLSSEAVGRPRAGLVAYASSKAALEESLRGWRAEHPGLRFGCVTVGATVPTEFGNEFDPEVMTSVFEDWTRHGLWQEEFMDTEQVARVVVGTLAAVLANPSVGVEQLTLRSPSAIIGGPTV
jgi:NAD(P)-dependent dehydrogenase (short-subunit alcohol dehydrogenase family)